MSILGDLFLVEKTPRRKRPIDPTKHSCGGCIHYWIEYESESYYDTSYVVGFHCDAKPWVSNLKQFPFDQTSCKEWTNERSKPEYPE